MARNHNKMSIDKHSRTEMLSNTVSRSDLERHIPRYYEPKIDQDLLEKPRLGRNASNVIVIFQLVLVVREIGTTIDKAMRLAFLTRNYQGID